MEADNKLKIQGNYKAIVDTLNVRDVEDHLIQNGILTEEEHELVSMKGITRQEGVRRLLKILKKKPKGFSCFCDALRDYGYDFLSIQILATDPSSVSAAAPDETDSMETEKMNQLQSQLWMTTQLMQKFKEEIDQLKDAVQEHSYENKVIKGKFVELENTMQEKGLTQCQVIAYLEDYVEKKEHPNRQAIECPDGSSVDAGANLRRKSMGDPSNLTEAIARHLAIDVVRFMATGEDDSKPSSNKYQKIMRKTVSLMTNAHRDLFNEFLIRLEINDINGYETLGKVADELFSEGESNWGRVVALYAYGGYIAKMSDDKDGKFAEMIGDFLGFYVSTKLSVWIEANGGWEGFVEYFEDKKGQKNMDDRLNKAFICSLIAITAAVVGTVVTVRHS